ncbi:MAG: hypothetical protein DI533_06320 [Cereibacter sphaeroides]|uniref:DUF2946 domain-containing protein n=1 Tax=Cereibacter sphaeroides TaxID=1063 RepID=A0A2W5SKQ6_CERSP|nr:MAG: hypothetical protein DI533_06320 [Cereibacter sphaeroides]
MIVSSFRTRVLILAAYFLTVLLSVLALDTGRQQSQADHAQMMAMAGHMASMPATDDTGDLTQQLLCQQHCLFGAAALPASNRIAEVVTRATAVEISIDLLAASLDIPPPGPPPKFVVI